MDFDTKFDPRPTIPNLDELSLKNRITRLAGQTEPVTLTALSGGYRNINCLVDSVNGRFVARASVCPRQEAEIETEIMARAAKYVPVPALLDTDFEDKDDGLQIMLLDYVEGVSLAQTEDRLSGKAIDRLGEQLGAAAASFHSASFEETGFFSRGLAIDEPAASVKEMFVSFMRTCLAAPLVRSRLRQDPSHAEVSAFLDRADACLDGSLPQTRLVHSDFNQKNILVRQTGTDWNLAAILDWEFGYSGCPLADLGNFFRFETEQPPYRAAFIRGYRDAGGILPDRWRQIAAFLDLAAMLSFLREETDRTRTHQTARAVIQRTLTEWDTL